ncbi:rod shape-determining protein RodA [Odoribacter sp. OttesenSCG-928-L07]|nr:rod shape-determining protein RodA [Odoribacter sp. OttesenSCG-928-L07]MDL2239333.1 rod shape-determining protein RodA [Bacteroidales bacterium OttesenSCG-928-L14]MDL2240378.1 rod shape-determining protein RodA [Bacteroidales bacterium OttesenSCG-928-K22]
MDFVVVIIYVVLVAFGLFNIFSTTSEPFIKNIDFSFATNYGRQAIFIGVSFVVAAIILIMDAEFFSRLSYIIYALIILLLILVLIIGSEISGAKAWIQIGSFSLQPAEFAKFATALALSKYLSANPFPKMNYKNRIITLAIIFLPVALIMLQPDAGSALVFLSFFIALFREGLSIKFVLFVFYLIAITILSLLIDKFILIGVIVGAIVLLYFFLRKQRNIIAYLSMVLVVSAICIFSVDFVYDRLLQSHQKDRIEVLLGKKTDIQGIGYNVHQSKIAIGSGGFSGKGYLNGTQTKFNFVPEQQTDFIFCTVGEEFGFIGSLFVLGLFLTLIIRIIILAERQRTAFSRIYGYCVAGILFLHVTINISMTIGLLPVIGIPLPFFSYGGSSLIAFTILLFIFVKLDTYRFDLLNNG